MIDTHCHIYSEYYDDISSLIDDIKKNGINKIIINGCDMKSNLEVLKLTKKYDIVYGALGFHPTELDNYSDDSIKWLEENINNDKIVAIGEIGLDYHYENADKEKQINVHTRDAIQDTYNILKKYKLKGSIHAFSGSLEMAKEFINLGYYIGVGGVCTFKNAKNIVNVIKNISTEYILLETDSPYLTPEPYRGKINTPKNISIIADKIAEIKQINISEVVDVTTDNANALFDF